MRVRLIIGFLIISFGLTVLNGGDLSAQTYTRRYDVAPVRLSYGELLDLVAGTRDLIRTSNSSYSPTYERPHESLYVDDGAAQVSLTQDFSPASLVGAPEIGYSMTYEYRFADGPVSHVSVRLSDYSRNIQVEGKSRSEVDSISNFILSTLSRYTFSFAGPGFRTLGSLALTLFGWSLMIFAVMAPIPLRNRILLLTTALFVWLGLFLLPWQNWLPGTAVYAGDASWLRRNSPLLTFLGAMLPVAGAIYKLVSWLLNQVRQSSQQNGSEQSGHDQPAHLM